MKNQIKHGTLKRFGYIALIGNLLFSPASLSQILVDPTRPPTSIYNPQAMPATSTSPQSLVLNATFIYPDKRLAIINGQPVKIGDKIGEFTITHITPYTVELVGSQGNKETLQLVVDVKSQIKRP